MIYFLRFMGLLFFFIILSGCAYHHGSISHEMNLKESWAKYIVRSDWAWRRGSDAWFPGGDPNQTEVAYRYAPSSAAISQLKVNVINFTHIKIEGDFQVQLFGTEEPNSVYLLGSNQILRYIAVEMRGDQLCIRQLAPLPNEMKQVIVRIGVKNLRGLDYSGNGLLQGIGLKSDGLAISAKQDGRIYLTGKMNVSHILHQGRGDLTIFGAYANHLVIDSMGEGRINVSGNLDVRTIKHSGSGDINLIGVNSRKLAIFAQGMGKIGMTGRVNVCDITAQGQVKIYIDGVQSRYLQVNLSDQVIVGLSGFVQDTLSLNANQYAAFLGRYLCTSKLYVFAKDHALMNVRASKEAFISAKQSSQVFLYGPLTILSQYQAAKGNVFPVIEGLNACPVYAYRSVVHAPKEIDLFQQNKMLNEKQVKPKGGVHKRQKKARIIYKEGANA